MRFTFALACIALCIGCDQGVTQAPNSPRPETNLAMPHPELEFFNSLSGKLEFQLSEPTERVGNLTNERATPNSKIESLEFNAEVFNRDSKTFRPLTAEELQAVAFKAPQIRLRGEAGEVVSHNAPNGEVFTVQNLLDAVAETERQTRNNSEWLGGVDVHHVYFEGIWQEEDAWQIAWGS